MSKFYPYYIGCVFVYLMYNLYIEIKIYLSTLIREDT